MAWYAYCIVEQQAVQGGIRARRPVPVEGLKGIADAQIFAYPSGDFSVLVSEYIPTGDLGQKALLQHAHVVSECFKRTTVLPFRFGTVFDTDDALRRAVRINRKGFLESVTKLKGKAEMHLKLLIKDGSLREAMEEGAWGLSTGLDYPPGSYADTDELVGLSTEAARLGGIYHSHVRYRLGDRFLDPFREAIELRAIFTQQPADIRHGV